MKDNNELIPFDFKGHQITAIVDDKGEPWFKAKDVCSVLDLRVQNVVGSLDEDEVYSIDLTDSLGRIQTTYIISESGLYSTILRSRKPEAKLFKKWVTSEVLPSIRKTGKYDLQGMTLADKLEMFAKGYLEEREKNKQLSEEIIELTEVVEDSKPKVEFYDDYASW